MYVQGKQRLPLLLSLSLMLTLAADIFAAQDKPRDDIRDEDKAEVIRLTLDYALVKKSIPDYNFIKDPNNVTLSTNNISADLLPKFDDINLILLMPEEIQEKAEEDGNYIYFLEFKEIKAEGEIIVVKINHVPKYAKNPQIMAFGGSVTIKYRKEDGKWKGEVTSWIIA